MPRRQSHTFQQNTTVRTTPELSRSEFLAPKHFKQARRTASAGLITGMLGKWYLVRHEDGVTAIYNEAELQPESAAYWKVIHTIQGASYFKELATHVEVLLYLDELADQGSGVTTKTEGPFYSDKELTEGPMATRTLFDHLTEEP